MSLPGFERERTSFPPVTWTSHQLITVFIQALANHGLIPHDGRRVRPSQLAAALARAYNLSPTIAYQLLAPMYQIWEGRGWFDLHDIAVPGLVAHDGSFTVRPVLPVSKSAHTCLPVELTLTGLCLCLSIA